MATPSGGAAPSLEVRRVFRVPRPKMFRMFTEREHLESWMCRPDPRNVIKYLELDLREGGGYLLENRIADGGRFMNRGTYRAFRPPEKISWEWGWDHLDPSGKKLGELRGTLVTVELHEAGDSTEVVLTHELFPTAEMRDLHQQGWNACFDRLEEHLGLKKSPGTE